MNSTNTRSNASRSTAQGAPQNGAAGSRELGLLTEKIRQLEAENIELKSTIQTQAQANQESDTDNHPSSVERKMADHDLNVCGKKYSVMVSPWLEPKVLEELTSADFAASIQSSDQSSESTRHEAARELYNMLPPAERNNIDADRIATHFVKGVTLQRQTSSHRTRRMIGGDLFGPQVHLKDEERGDHFRHTHLGYLDDKKLYPRRAPVLCAGGAPNIHTLFRRGELIEIARGLLFGPQSIHGGMLGPMTSAKVNAACWGVDSTTPGLIAVCAVLARFSVSADSSFQKVGGKTKIPYYEDFVWYKRLLETHRRKAPIRALFDLWNERLFRGLERQPVVDDDSMDTDLNELQALDDEASESEGASG